MFWGLIMEPNKRYTQVVEKPFHISQAAMDTSMGDSEPCQVMVVVDEKNFLICTLQKGKNIQMNLDLYFKQGESIAFLTNGKSNVHLTGYLDPEFEEDLEHGEEEEESEEEKVPVLVPTKNKRKFENTNEAPSSKKIKQEKKPKKAVAANSDASDSEDSDDQLKKILDAKDVDSDENDESFKLNTTEADSDEEDSDDEEEQDEEESSEEEENEEKTEEETETTVDTSQDETVDTSKLSKSQRRRLAKKLAQAKMKGNEQPQVNGVDKTKKKEGQQKENQQQKKKPEGKKETQDGQTGDKKEKKTLSGGVFIEDIKVGDGPVAKAGKTVMVYYEGRLKQNNKMFDNCARGPGFKFRLGGKEVISGWDIGVVGMKVGGRRKIVCPPNMAYGAKGTPPVIPPNSTLVFDVELKNVK